MNRSTSNGRNGELSESASNMIAITNPGDISEVHDKIQAMRKKLESLKNGMISQVSLENESSSPEVDMPTLSTIINSDH